MKYLGIQFTDNGKTELHINKRVSSTIKAAILKIFCL